MVPNPGCNTASEPICSGGTTCQKCQKSGTPGDGTGDSQGNCASAQICYSTGECGICSNDAQNGAPGTGTGVNQGNCPSNQICYPNGCGVCSKDGSTGTPGNGDGSSRGNCPENELCTSSGCGNYSLILYVDKREEI